MKHYWTLSQYPSTTTVSNAADLLRQLEIKLFRLALLYVRYSAVSEWPVLDGAEPSPPSHHLSHPASRSECFLVQSACEVSAQKMSNSSSSGRVVNRIKD